MWVRMKAAYGGALLLSFGRLRTTLLIPKRSKVMETVVTVSLRSILKKARPITETRGFQMDHLRFTLPRQMGQRTICMGWVSLFRVPSPVVASEPLEQIQIHRIQVVHGRLINGRHPGINGMDTSLWWMEKSKTAGPLGVILIKVCLSKPVTITFLGMITQVEKVGALTASKISQSKYIEVKNIVRQTFTLPRSTVGQDMNCTGARAC